MNDESLSLLLLHYGIAHLSQRASATEKIVQKFRVKQSLCIFTDWAAAFLFSKIVGVGPILMQNFQRMPTNLASSCEVWNYFFMRRHIYERVKGEDLYDRQGFHILILPSRNFIRVELLEL